MNVEYCCLGTNGRCPYEVNNKCTARCGGERPYGKALCEIEKLKFKNEEEFKVTKEELEKFLLEFLKAVKNKNQLRIP